MIKALVACHDEPILTKEKRNQYPLAEYMNHINNTYFKNKDVEYYTVDIKEKSYIPKNHFVNDLWGNKFIQDNTEEYDIVYIQACDGVWAEHHLEPIIRGGVKRQKLDKARTDLSELIESIRNHNSNKIKPFLLKYIKDETPGSLNDPFMFLSPFIGKGIIDPEYDESDNVQYITVEINVKNINTLKFKYNDKILLGFTLYTNSHWISYVYYKNGWYECNDDMITYFKDFDMIKQKIKNDWLDQAKKKIDTTWVITDTIYGFEHSLKDGEPFGLNNYGGTCWLNSALQLLLATNLIAYSKDEHFAIYKHLIDKVLQIVKPNGYLFLSKINVDSNRLKNTYRVIEDNTTMINFNKKHGSWYLIQKIDDSKTSFPNKLNILIKNVTNPYTLNLQNNNGKTAVYKEKEQGGEVTVARSTPEIIKILNENECKSCLSWGKLNNNFIYLKKDFSLYNNNPNQVNLKSLAKLHKCIKAFHKTDNTYYIDLNDSKNLYVRKNDPNYYMGFNVFKERKNKIINTNYYTMYTSLLRSMNSVYSRYKNYDEEIKIITGINDNDILAINSLENI